MEKTNERKLVAIQVSGVKKMYRLGQIGGGTLQADLQSWWARVRGKEDPNTKIGEDQRSNGETFMALNGIDLTIYQGETVGIIGSNGAGKSTLLKLLSKVTAPTEGEIDIYGRIASMLEVGTGFNGEMTGRENVYLNGAILGMTKSEIDAKMEQIIEFSEVREFIDTPVKRYSSGMFVKLAFSVAAHLDSEIMIMDEVLAVGDVSFQQKCLTRMREAAKKEGRTVLYVSHNMNTIRQLCDRCIVLDKGKVIYEGDVERAISLYIGTGNVSELPTWYDLTTIKRHSGFGESVYLKTVSLLNKKIASYEVGEAIDIEVEIESKVDLTDATIIIPIRTKDYLKIGMALSGTFDLQRNVKTLVRFRTYLKELADDLYCLDIGLMKKDDAGNFTVYDNPGVRILLETKNNHAHNIAWKKEYWGNVMLSEMEILDQVNTPVSNK